MWIPKSASEIQEAARRGDLEETHTFDAKAALPVAAKNHDLAVDVDAMTVDGGTLLYGLGEDKNKRLTVLSPIALAGVAERVAQIAETSISEPPFIRVHPLPLETDASQGYLLIVVPQSARAPHQVISAGDMRYYGRGAKGNRILSEAELAALYARRERWEVDREDLLTAELEHAPPANPALGYVVAFVRPAVPDDSMVERVTATEQNVGQVLLDGARSWGDVRPNHEGRGFSPDLREALYTSRRGTSGWRISTVSQDLADHPEYTAAIDLDFDGTAHFFCGRVADTMMNGTFVLLEMILARNLASFFAAIGALYETAGYVGHADVGMAVTGIEGAAPFGLHQWGDVKFTGPPPRRTARVSVAELRDDAKTVAESLIRRLLDATRGPTYTPFEEPSTP